MASVKVFGSPMSAEVARVLMCLFEKDVEFQLIRVDAYRGPNRMPQYLKLQPLGEALTFEDDNLTLSESRGILRHISHKYAKQGNPDLIGTGALERASIEQWLQTEAQSFDVPSAEMVYSLAFLPPAMPQKLNNGGDGNGNGYGANGNAIGGNGNVAAVNASVKRVAAGAAGTAKEEEMRKVFEKSQRELEKLLDIYEQRLEEAEYLAGDKFTIADLSHLPNADRLASHPRSSRMFQRRKNVSRWWDKVSQREAWAYVKSLQRQPAPNGAGADAAQNQQQPRSGEARNGSNNYQRDQYADARDGGSSNNNSNYQRDQYADARDSGSNSNNYQRNQSGEEHDGSKHSDYQQSRSGDARY
ncbi:glutathione S-transferase F10-like [Hordeum vulgare subsp. vulgare]|uniref:glutathione transferase n=1 Tax=Hordeum vulgare subsp. vulgare TaxID=112509 RepID=A0A8I6XKW9_HORVV|nr:glutathione S-transferase F10-like [Hordeum vulgare subsp. vulgare]